MIPGNNLVSDPNGSCMDERGKRDVHSAYVGPEVSFLEARIASSPSASLARPALVKAVGKEGRGNEQRGTSSEESKSGSSGIVECLTPQMATKAEAEGEPNAKLEQEVKVGSDDVQEATEGHEHDEQDGELWRRS